MQTAKQIEKAIEAFFDLTENGTPVPDFDAFTDEWKERPPQSWKNLGELDRNVWLSIPGVHDLVYLVEWKGGEGQGDYCHLCFTIGGRHFLKTGYYASHHGFEFEGDFFEVKPVKRVIDDWEPVK